MLSDDKSNIDHCLIVEGGGFKTGYTSGLLDAFIVSKFDPFTSCLGISGGAVALSYFLADQYRGSLNSLLHLAKDENFLNYRRTFGKEGYMDIDMLKVVAQEKVPFDINKAFSDMNDKDVRFVLTHRESGDAYYMHPNKENWLDLVTASCTLPFVTKGRHVIDGEEYFDGGWSDAIPAQRAYERGAKRITILRTWPKDVLSTQSWADYFGSIYFKSTSGLQKTFEQSYEKYNKSIKFINNPPKDLIIDQLCPFKLLKSGTYSYSKKTIMSDYRYGLDLGMQYVATFK